MSEGEMEAGEWSVVADLSKEGRREFTVGGDSAQCFGSTKFTMEEVRRAAREGGSAPILFSMRVVFTSPLGESITSTHMVVIEPDAEGAVKP